MQSAGLDAHVAGHSLGGMQQGLPLADGDGHFRRRERQQLAKPPDAAQAERIVAAGPFLLEEVPGAGRPGIVPIIGHIEQSAALGAGDAHLIDAVRRLAAGGNALLEGDFGLGGHARTDATERQRVKLGAIVNGE